VKIPPIEESITPEVLAAFDPEQRAMWERLLEQRAEGRRLIDEYVNAGDWNHALIMLDSQNRAPMLIRAGEELTDLDALRELVAEWWSTTEAWSGDPELREGMFRTIRNARPVIVPSEDVSRFQTPPEGEFKVYRGNLGEEPYGGCGSWTLDPKIAEKFAAGATSLRGMLVLGMNPNRDGVPTVWEGTCRSKDVLGFFDDRHEYEIVTDVVSDIHAIREAR
jgi:hypothetical protein